MDALFHVCIISLQFIVMVSSSSRSAEVHTVCSSGVTGMRIGMEQMGIMQSRRLNRSFDPSSSS